MPQLCTFYSHGCAGFFTASCHQSERARTEDTGILVTRGREGLQIKYLVCEYGIHGADLLSRFCSGGNVHGFCFSRPRWLGQKESPRAWGKTGFGMKSLQQKSHYWDHRFCQHLSPFHLLTLVQTLLSSLPGASVCHWQNWDGIFSVISPSFSSLEKTGHNLCLQEAAGG